MNILVVDDSKIIRIMIIRILNELGYDTITEAVDVDSALSKIKLEKPDLIFSDYNMPGKTGVDFLKAVRENPATSTVPFILVTTVHDKKIIVEAVKSGLQYFILKPVEKAVLAEKLTALAESHKIQPPRIAAKPAVATATETTAQQPADAASGQNVKIPLETLDAILDHFFLVFDGEMSISDFLSWAKEHIIKPLPENEDFRDEQQLLDFLRSSAHKGMFTELRKYSA
jgi:two-component system, chemotaxis family, chemotaxis protein CheY